VTLSRKLKVAEKKLKIKPKAIFSRSPRIDPRVKVLLQNIRLVLHHWQ
jgi:hypothetical protein